MGLYPQGKGERVGLKGEDRAFVSTSRASRVPDRTRTSSLSTRTAGTARDICRQPSLERTWTQRDALVSMKNPKKDIGIYLEADTNAKAFHQPRFSLSRSTTRSASSSVENSEVFLRKIRVKGEDLGTDEWGGSEATLNESFVPKSLGFNNDDREWAPRLPPPRGRGRQVGDPATWEPSMPDRSTFPPGRRESPQPRLRVTAVRLRPRRRSSRLFRLELERRVEDHAVGPPACRQAHLDPGR